MNKVFLVTAEYRAYGDVWTEIRAAFDTEHDAVAYMQAIPEEMEYTYEVVEMPLRMSDVVRKAQLFGLPVNMSEDAYTTFYPYYVGAKP